LVSATHVPSFPESIQSVCVWVGAGNQLNLGDTLIGAGMGPDDGALGIIVKLIADLPQPDDGRAVPLRRSGNGLRGRQFSDAITA